MDKEVRLFFRWVFADDTQVTDRTRGVEGVVEFVRESVAGKKEGSVMYQGVTHEWTKRGTTWETFSESMAEPWVVMKER